MMFEPTRYEGNWLDGAGNPVGPQQPLDRQPEGAVSDRAENHVNDEASSTPWEAAGASAPTLNSPITQFHGPHAPSPQQPNLLQDADHEEPTETAIANHSHMDTGFSEDRFSVDSVSALEVDDHEAGNQPACPDNSRRSSSRNRTSEARTVTSRAFERQPVGQSPILQAFITLCMLACTLAAARYWVPSIIEEGRYAWRRGQLRADYEASGEGLSAVGMDSLAVAYQMVTQRVAPSVVHIEVIKTQDFEQSDIRSIARGEPFGIPTSDQGSGVVVSEDGYIVTNDHVVSGGNVITVGLSDGRRVRGQVVGTDPLTDLALLKIHADGLTPIQWADSDEAEVGTPVWAIGSPFGLDRTVTFGILSGKHRAAKAGTSYQDFMQSDVAVNPGNSGGPLVDGRGRLVGINTAIVGETYRGVSFSIPSNVAQRVYERLRKSGKFERGWLGVELAEVSDREVPGRDLRVRGAKVRSLVDPASPAALAGLTSGDIIIRFDGDEVSDQGALMRMVGNWPAGQTAVLDVIRDGSEKSISVEIGTRPTEYNLR